MDTRFFRRTDRGFTLLEIVIAVTLLATFLLPMLLIISQSKIRAIRYTMQRQVRDLAQRKLFDRVHYYETNDQGEFTLEGHPDWHWEIEPPQMIGSGEQVLLQYNIRVTLPQKLEGDPSATSQDGTEGSTYQMSLWTFPDSYWYEEQQQLYEQGGYSSLYGNRSMSGGSY